MADDRAALLAKLEELDKKEMGAEAARLVARLHEIRVEAAKTIVAFNEAKATDKDNLFAKAANLAEEAAQHGVRLVELGRE